MRASNACGFVTAAERPVPPCELGHSLYFQVSSLPAPPAPQPSKCQTGPCKLSAGLGRSIHGVHEGSGAALPSAASPRNSRPPAASAWRRRTLHGMAHTAKQDRTQCRHGRPDSRQACTGAAAAEGHHGFEPGLQPLLLRAVAPSLPPCHAPTWPCPPPDPAHLRPPTP